MQILQYIDDFSSIKPCIVLRETTFLQPNYEQKKQRQNGNEPHCKQLLNHIVSSWTLTRTIWSNNSPPSHDSSAMSTGQKRHGIDPRAALLYNRISSSSPLSSDYCWLVEEGH